MDRHTKHALDRHLTQSDDTHDSESDYDLGYRFGTAHLASEIRERRFMRLLTTLYERPQNDFGVGFNMALRDGFVAHLEQLTPAPDPDPVCVCGTHKSEHALCGCGEWEPAKENGA
jgi:hypothetical protein